MTAQGRAVSTMCSKGARYSSRSGRGAIRLSTVKRSVSASLPTKCLTVVPTPPSWTPVTYPAPITPVRYWSSEKHSKWRPPSGERCRLTVGASRTCTPLRRASWASSRPARRASSGSQVAASAVGLGRATDGSAAPHPWPRTPTGPSDMTRDRSPISGTAGSVQTSCPDSSRALVSRSSLPRAFSTATAAAAVWALRWSVIRLSLAWTYGFGSWA